MDEGGLEERHQSKKGGLRDRETDVRAPEGDGSGDGVKNTGAVTPVYASLKHTLFNFPDFELYMTELIYVFLVSTFAQQYVIFPNKIFIKIRPEVLSSY